MSDPALERLKERMRKLEEGFDFEAERRAQRKAFVREFYKPRETCRLLTWLREHDENNHVRIAAE